MKIKTVFVDDDPNIADLVRICAKGEGVDVQFFENGTDALTYLTTHQADAVILDLALPVLDGLTIAEEVRRNEEIRLIEPPVKMAFLTAQDVNEAIERVADRVNIEKIFRKPVSYPDVFREIKAWFEPKQESVAR